MRDMQPAFLEPAALEELLGRDDVRVLDCSWFAPSRGDGDPTAAAVEFARTGSRELRSSTTTARATPARACRTRFRARRRSPRTAARSRWRATTWSCCTTARPAAERRAAAAWLVFALYGHPRVALLAGGLARWVSEDALVHGATATVAPEQRAPYAGAVEDESSQLRVDDVLNNLRTQRTQLIDCHRRKRTTARGARNSSCRSTGGGSSSPTPRGPHSGSAPRLGGERATRQR